jgi:hypothetical protein
MRLLAIMLVAVCATEGRPLTPREERSRCKTSCKVDYDSCVYMRHAATSSTRIDTSSCKDGYEVCRDGC